MSSLGSLTSPAAGSRAGAVLAVPIGSTEQHGPHLPLCTDTSVASALCARLAEARDVVVAPALPYGSSGEHEGFPGTLSIGQDALELVLLELCRSATLTFSRVLLVSGHGGNAVPLARAVERLRFEGRDVLAWSPSWSGDAHAGRTETSLALALGLPVDVGAAEPGDVRPLRETLPLLMAGGVRAVSANGVLGDPRGASAAEGEALLRSLTEDLVGFADRWPVPVSA